MASGSSGCRISTMGTAMGGALLAAVLVSVPAAAQNAARERVVAGTVRDSSGAGIAGAEVELLTTLQRGTTDETGAFRISGVMAAVTGFHVRRLGFRPDTVALAPGAGDTTFADVRLTPIAQRLEPVVVVAGGAKYNGRLAGYYQRLARRSSGQFITREEIDRERPRLLTHMLQRVPGLQSMPARGAVPSVVRMRGRGCAPLVWVDGTPALSGDVDLDGFAPSSIEGIELYLGATGAPGNFQWTREASNCGTILLWSRDMQRRTVAASDDQRTGELQQLIDAAALFTAADVDTVALPIAGEPLVVTYPPALRASRISGRVVAEFVVDTTGHTLVPTIGIVSTTHALLSEAVEEALPRAMFQPATRGGRRVPQLVQQTFEFVPDTEPRARR